MKAITRFGPQPAILEGPYYECGICNHHHSVKWDGDCRDNANRFTCEQLDAYHGPHGWIEVPMPTWEG